MSDRFDFEQKIMNCWHVVDDMKMLCEASADTDAFDALARIYQIKFEVLFSQFETLIAEGKIV